MALGELANHRRRRCFTSKLQCLSTIFIRLKNGPLDDGKILPESVSKLLLAGPELIERDGESSDVSDSNSSSSSSNDSGSGSGDSGSDSVLCAEGSLKRVRIKKKRKLTFESLNASLREHISREVV